jgi:hypothetical protein
MGRVVIMVLLAGTLGNTAVDYALERVKLV